MSSHPESVAARSVVVQRSPEFQHLKRSFVGFIAPLTILFLLWYIVYVILAGWAPGLFAIKVFGEVNVGLLLGLGQVVTTFAITMLYRWWADKKYDPQTAELRAEMERGEITGLDAVDGGDAR